MRFRTCAASIITCVSLIACFQAVQGGDPFPEKGYPNIVPPIAQFGDFGDRLGQMNEPVGIAFDSQSRPYIAESINSRVQVFDPMGHSIFSWTGSDHGELTRPEGIAIDGSDHVYLSDQQNHVVVYDKDGNFLSRFGSNGDKPGQFNGPAGLAVSGGRLYVVDEGNNRVQVFDTSGKALLQIGKYGPYNGQFIDPLAVAADDSGNSYVVDQLHRIQKFDAKGQFVQSWGIYGGMPGQLAEPHGLYCQGDHLYVADTVNHRLQVFTTDGKFVTQWGRHPESMHAGKGRTHYPSSIAVSPDGGFVAIAEPFEYRSQIYETDKIRNLPQVNVSSWWEKFPRFHYGGGLRIGRANRVQALHAMALKDSVSAEDLVVITEPDIHKVVTFRVAPSGKLMPHYSLGEYGNGPGKFGMLAAKQATKAGKLLIGDAGNQVVQQFDLVTGKYIDTHFGPGKGPGQFNGPSDFLEGSNGLLYISDYHNDRIQVFDQNFKFKFLFGGTGAANGKMFCPISMAASPDRNRIYEVDAGNDRIQVFDLRGKYLFHFGRLTRPGELGHGTFRDMFDVAVAPDGSVYATDTAQQLVQKFTASGKFLTQWGHWGTQPGQFYKPKGIDVDSQGRVYVVDFGNHRGQIFDSNGKFLAIFGEGILYPQLKSNLMSTVPRAPLAGY